MEIFESNCLARLVRVELMGQYEWIESAYSPSVELICCCRFRLLAAVALNIVFSHRLEIYCPFEPPYNVVAVVRMVIENQLLFVGPQVPTQKRWSTENTFLIRFHCFSLQNWSNCLCDDWNANEYLEKMSSKFIHFVKCIGHFRSHPYLHTFVIDSR